MTNRNVNSDAMSIAALYSTSLPTGQNPIISLHLISMFSSRSWIEYFGLKLTLRRIILFSVKGVLNEYFKKLTLLIQEKKPGFF